MKRQDVINKKTIICLNVSLLACGSMESPTNNANKETISQQSSDQRSSHSAIPSLEISRQKHTVTSLETIAELDYKNTDYTSVIRCVSSFKLRAPNQNIIRHPSGVISPATTLEKQAAWEFALASPSSCKLLGEKVMRISFSDALAPTGQYFYLFKPCIDNSGQNSMLCSFDFVSTGEISVRNTISEKTYELSQQFNKKEARLASLAIALRRQLSESLNAQLACENNEAVDAVKEAKWKALSSILATGVAAAIGGAVAGPEGAVTVAKKTLQWIVDNVAPGTVHNPTKCQLLKDAEKSTQELAKEMDVIQKEMSYLQEEIAQIESTR